MKHIESNTQQAIVKYLRMNKIFCFAVSNGGRKDLITGSRLKAEGQLAGVSALIVLTFDDWDDCPVCSFVEIKSKIGRQSLAQKEFQANIEELGFEYLIWRSVDDAINFVKANEPWNT